MGVISRNTFKRYKFLVSKEFFIMNNPVLQELEKLSKDTLIELIKMYSQNWMTLDGLWFSGMEEKYGLDTALEFDVRMWQIGSMIEAKRIKNVLNLEKGGLYIIIKTINFMTWAPSFGYEYTISGNKAI